MDMISTGFHGEKKNRLKIISQLGHLLPQLSPCAHYLTICCDFENLAIVCSPPPRPAPKKKLAKLVEIKHVEFPMFWSKMRQKIFVGKNESSMPDAHQASENDFIKRRR